MDMKVNQVNQAAPAEQIQSTPPSDGTFKFMLASHIEEAELQTRLQGLMEEITMQGKKLSKHMDIRDMKHYRELIKEFMNEIVNRSHKFSRENFLDRRGRHRVYGMIKLIDKLLSLIFVAVRFVTWKRAALLFLLQEQDHPTSQQTRQLLCVPMKSMQMLS